MKRRDFLTLSIKAAMAAGYTAAIPAALLKSHNTHAAILAAGLSDPERSGGRKVMSKTGLIILAAVSLMGAGIAWWQSNANSASQAVHVNMPELSVVERQGHEMFAANCATCHGVNAGGTGQGPPLIHIYYEPNHHPDAAFYSAIAVGVRQHHWSFGNMPPVEGLSEEQSGKIIAFIRAVQRANGIE